VFTAEQDGKQRVNYQGWAEVKVFLPGERLELVAAGGQVRRGEAIAKPVPAPYRAWDGD
jgi:hypothetical protein